MFKIISMLLIIPFLSNVAFATEPMKEDNKHVRTWNKFANDCLALHKQLTDGKHHKVEKSIGSYANVKNFYTEHRYLKGDKLVSKVQWEKDDPETLHTIEVYVHDDEGRVTRDFMAAYLPFYHNAPTQTLISFHHYTGDLHSFRTFDASGDKILERCEGKNAQGQVVNMLLDEDDLFNDPDELIGSKEYNECFAGLTQNELGKYIVPQ